MKTAESDPVSSSESQGRPRSYSLLPISFAPEILMGERSELMLPTRVGMLSVWAALRVARMAVTTVVWRSMMKVLK